MEALTGMAPSTELLPGVVIPPHQSHLWTIQQIVDEAWAGSYYSQDDVHRVMACVWNAIQRATDPLKPSTEEVLYPKP